MESFEHALNHCTTVVFYCVDMSETPSGAQQKKAKKNPN